MCVCVCVCGHVLQFATSYNQIVTIAATNIPVHNTGAQFRTNHWYLGFSPCVYRYFRLFTLSQGEKAILGRSARCAISAFFFNNGTQTSHQSVHGNLICLNIHSLYIQIWRITTKLAILFSTQQCGKMIFNKWTFIVDPVIFLRTKIPNGIFHYELCLLKMILPQLCRE